ncbi:MAG: glycosyltransferase family 10, partial [Cyanobacteria bacterium J06648_11]
LGLPPELSEGTLGDLGPQDHVICHPKSSFYLTMDFGVQAQVSLVIAEPYAVHWRHFYMLRLFHRRFFRILTRRRLFVREVPNAVYFNHFFAQVADVPDGIPKTRQISIIASGMRKLVGHKLRHSVIDRIRAEGLEVDVLGRAYKPFDKKWEGLAPYRYSVVIENSREEGYVTEKLIDTLLCDTIPIYWGAPDIAEMFDTHGMILCESEDGIMDVLRGPEAFLATSAPDAMRDNRQRALDLLNSTKRMAELVYAEAVKAP